MEWIVLILALIIEISLAAYCLYTKSYQTKVRQYVRIGALIVFILFTSISVIQWSFSWMLFAFLLLVCAILGVWKLIRNKEPRKGYSINRTIGKAVMMLLIITLALTPALVFPQYQVNSTGPYKVETAKYTYTDENRVETFTDTGESRRVTVEYWYPEQTDGNYPLIVFSHGAFGIGASNTSAYEEMASNGYVVGAISHTYHATATIDTNNKLTLGNQAFIQEVMDMNNGQYTEKEIYNLSIKWMELRTTDIDFVLDTILQNVELKVQDPVYTLIDPEKIGLIGHSMGGSAVSSVGRERHDIGAVINLDAPLFGELTGFQGDTMTMRNDAYPLPLLNVYSDDLWGKMDLDSMYFANARLVSDPPKDIFNIHFQGARHLSLTDLPLFSPLLANMLNRGRASIDAHYCIETLNTVMLQFMDYYLKETGSFVPLETY